VIPSDYGILKRAKKSYLLTPNSPLQERNDFSYASSDRKGHLWPPSLWEKECEATAHLHRFRMVILETARTTPHC